MVYTVCMLTSTFRHFAVRVLSTSFLLVLAVSCRRIIPPHYELLMGTVCTVDAFEDGSEQLYDEVFERLEELELIFNPTRADSEVTAVNAAAGLAPVEVSHELFLVLSEAISYAKLTDGALNPAIGPLVNLWGILTNHEHVPTDSELKQVLPLCNWNDVELLPAAGGAASGEASADRVYLKRQGMAIDLGCIVKGYAADQVVSILKKRRVKRAVVNLGGNVYVFGIKPDGSPWRIGVKNPKEPGGPSAAMMDVKECSAVTSGMYERYFEQNGKRYHHILDSATGFPADTGIASVTVISLSSLQADALSTALFVLGKEAGMKLLEGIPEVQALFIDNEGVLSATPGFPY